MLTVARLYNKGTQHDGYYETMIIVGSPMVFIDGLSAARTGDAVDCGGVVTPTGLIRGLLPYKPSEWKVS